MEKFKKIAIIGMGLIGGSMALALKKENYGSQVIGYDLSEPSLKAALKAEAIDKMARSLQDAVEGADLVVLSTPVGHYQALMQQMAAYLSTGAIVTDVGSVKGHVARLAEDLLPKEVKFIGGHPMAGSEQGGFKAATATLFENAYYFLTPQGGATDDGLEKLKVLVKIMGALPIVIDPTEHDRVAATISHIPHMTAAILVDILEDSEGISDRFFVGGGFRDTTRIASGNPEMWKDIFLYNRQEMLRGIQKIENRLLKIKGYLMDQNELDILNLLKRAKNLRDQIPHRLPDYIAPLFDITIDLEDRPGAIGELTQLLGENRINIKEIEVLHVREGVKGAIRIGLETEADEGLALGLLKERGFSLVHRRGVEQDAENQSS